MSTHGQCCQMAWSMLSNDIVNVVKWHGQCCQMTWSMQ